MVSRRETVHRCRVSVLDQSGLDPGVKGREVHLRLEPRKEWVALSKGAALSLLHWAFLPGGLCSKFSLVEKLSFPASKSPSWFIFFLLEAEAESWWLSPAAPWRWAAAVWERTPHTVQLGKCNDVRGMTYRTRAGLQMREFCLMPVPGTESPFVWY